MKKPPSIIVIIAHMEGPLKGQVQQFSQAEITIGRHASCDIRFPANQTTISRNHAKIIREGNKFKLIDTSSNGTLVNSKRNKEAWLKQGDVLTIAQGGPQFGFVTEFSTLPAEPEDLVPQPQVAPQPIVKIDNSPHQETPDILPPVPVQPAHSAPPVPRNRPPQSQALQSVSSSKVKAPVVIQYGPTIRSFRELPISLGKSPKCDCQLNHDLLLDEHAQIFFAGGEYWVKDLTGQKKVICNNAQIESQTTLQTNDEIGLTSSGPFFRFLGGGRFAELEKF